LAIKTKIEKKMTKILAIILIISFPIVCYADFTVEFKNTHSDTLIYLLYWLDHPFNSMLPANLAGGELSSKALRKLQNKYQYGKYLLIWRNIYGQEEYISEYVIKIDTPFKHVILYPSTFNTK
jgi:hypothetical protein